VVVLAEMVATAGRVAWVLQGARAAAALTMQVLAVQAARAKTAARVVVAAAESVELVLGYFPMDCHRQAKYQIPL